MIGLQTLLSRNEEKFLFNELGTETVVMDTESGDYLGLNEVGSEIWKLASKPVKVEELVKNLVDIYEVSREDCENQTLALLTKMESQGMLVIHQN